MVSVRGVNVYPAAIESIVRRFPTVVEFRSIISRSGAMRVLSIDIEVAPGTTDSSAVAAKLSQQILEGMGLKVAVRIVESDSLPRFEMKARRFVVEQ
jgi:phenylacetate-CoA ligase